MKINLRECNVVILTEYFNPAFYQIGNSNFIDINKLDDRYSGKHLYITSNEKLKMHDWCIANLKSNNREYHTQINNDTELEFANKLKLPKIIASTNSLIIRDSGHDSSKDDYIPGISNEWLIYWINEFISGNQIKNCKVEYLQPYTRGHYINKCSICGGEFWNTDKLGFICPDHEFVNLDINKNVIMEIK